MSLSRGLFAFLYNLYCVKTYCESHKMTINFIAFDKLCPGLLHTIISYTISSIWCHSQYGISVLQSRTDKKTCYVIWWKKTPIIIYNICSAENAKKQETIIYFQYRLTHCTNNDKYVLNACNVRTNFLQQPHESRSSLFKLSLILNTPKGIGPVYFINLLKINHGWIII